MKEITYQDKQYRIIGDAVYRLQKGRNGWFNWVSIDRSKNYALYYRITQLV